MKKFLAFDIGCYECSEDSAVVGVFNTEEEAEKANEKARKEQNKNWKGQHSFEVFEIEV